MGRPTPRTRLVRDTLRRFPDVPIKTLAKFLVHQHGALFNDDVERARHDLRRAAGRCGNDRRDIVKDEDKRALFRKAAVPMPPSRIVRRGEVRLPDGLWLVLGDLHIPFHEQKPLEAAIQHGQANKVTGVLLNGDFQDCHALSYWPAEKRDFLAEVEQTIDGLDFIRAQFPKAKIYYKMGNHEDRLPRIYMSYAPQLVGMPTVDWEVVLGLAQRGIEVVDSKQKLFAGKLPVIHGHEVRGGNPNAVNPARWIFLKAKDCCICSHFHRSSDHTEATIGGYMVSTWSIGCLCNLSPDYNPFCNNWNHGFALVDVHGESFEVENRRVLRTGKIV